LFFSEAQVWRSVDYGNGRKPKAPYRGLALNSVLKILPLVQLIYFGSARLLQHWHSACSIIKSTHTLEGKVMIDRTHVGFRCNVRHPLRTVKGNLPRGSEGTVVYELENLGRQLILVNWDCGISVPVFPDEVDLKHDDVARLQ
jgi:hypothetical protein